MSAPQNDSIQVPKESGSLNPWTGFWTVTAAFGTYFCMYGFRKPFTAASYEYSNFWGMDFKTIALTTQVFGYMVAKFLGIKIIAEMPPEKRVRGILFLILCAEGSLLLFGLIPRPWNAMGLFLNGLSLGMIFGLVLGFLEGRKATEALAAGLCTSFILADGVTKTVGAWLLKQQILGHPITEDWMPFVAGLIFFLPLCIALGMLSVVPPPSHSDIAARSERPTLSKAERWSFFGRYWFGLSMITVMYLLITIMRSFRSDFAPELWQGLGSDTVPSTYTRSEIFVGLGVMLMNGGAVLIKNNRIAFFTSIATSCFGCLLVCLALVLYSANRIGNFTFMVQIGIGLYLAYVAVHTTIFERLIAMTRERGNLGFLMYVADSIGYLGFIAVMIARNFFDTTGNFLSFYIALCWGLAVISLFCLLLSWRYFAVKKPVPAPIVPEAAR